MKPLLWRAALAALFVLITPTSPAQASQQEPLITVTGPTLIAFFPSVTERELRDEPDTNETLSDFQFYASRSLGPLRKAGIDFQQLYTRSFRIKTGKAVSRFQPVEAQVGYYFIAPGKKPQVVYGVVTDDDLIRRATEYFGHSAAK
jgi:hypothetical protein